MKYKNYDNAYVHISIAFFCCCLVSPHRFCRSVERWPVKAALLFWAVIGWCSVNTRWRWPARSALVGTVAGPFRRSCVKMTCVRVFLLVCLFLSSLCHTLKAEVSLWNIRIDVDSVSVMIGYIQAERRGTASEPDTSLWQAAKHVPSANDANS